MNVLIVGGAGYIGSHTAIKFRDAGHHVAVLDNLSTGREQSVPKNCTFYEGDIRTESDILDTFLSEERTGYPIEVVVNFAGRLIVSESVEKPLEYYQTNITGLWNILHAMKTCNIPHLVFSSSAAVYGESQNGICSETDCCVPLNPYGETKLAGEHMIEWVCDAQDITACSLRYFNVAGASWAIKTEGITHLIPLAVLAGLGARDAFYIYGDDYDTPDGTCIRDFIHVDDLADAHVLAAKYLLDGGDTTSINLGSTQGYSVKEVVQETQKFLDFDVQISPRRAGDPAKLVAVADRAQKVLGWKPKKSLSEMIQDEIKFRKNFLETGKNTLD